METEKQIRKYAMNFLAEMMGLISRYRGVEGENTLEHFEKRVEVERERYRLKFEALRFSEPGHVDAIDATARTVETIAAMETSRARSQGFVEFDPLIGEMYRNRVTMEKLLNQLEDGGNN